ncbi:hypothetical protein, partial [Bacteroides heparinolyticus]|uniref:hypothetical protein n=1 Tax=Prevotella heparinolytica TaxID=28113 RepID=UPI00359FC882
TMDSINGKSIDYRTPVKYLMLSIGAIPCSIFMFLGMGGGRPIVSIILGILCVATLAMAIIFLLLYFKRTGIRRIIIGQDQIHFVSLDNTVQKFPLNTLKSVDLYSTYDEMIELKAHRQPKITLSKSWIKRKEYRFIVSYLRENSVRYSYKYTDYR